MQKAEEYLNEKLQGAYQKYADDGITIISGIEHSEMCEIMEEYASIKCKELEDKYCRCSEEETTGSTTFECCNICGKILTYKTK